MFLQRLLLTGKTFYLQENTGNYRILKRAQRLAETLVIVENSTARRRRRIHFCSRKEQGQLSRARARVRTRMSTIVNARPLCHRYNFPSVIEGIKSAKFCKPRRRRVIVKRMSMSRRNLRLRRGCRNATRTRREMKTRGVPVPGDVLPTPRGAGTLYLH